MPLLKCILSYKCEKKINDQFGTYTNYWVILLREKPEYYGWLILFSDLYIFADMFTHCYKKETSDVAILLCYGEKCEDQHHQGCW